MTTRMTTTSRPTRNVVTRSTPPAMFIRNADPGTLAPSCEGHTAVLRAAHLIPRPASLPLSRLARVVSVRYRPDCFVVRAQCRQRSCGWRLLASFDALAFGLPEQSQSGPRYPPCDRLALPRGEEWKRRRQSSGRAGSASDLDTEALFAEVAAQRWPKRTTGTRANQVPDMTPRSDSACTTTSLRGAGRSVRCLA